MSETPTLRTSPPEVPLPLLPFVWTIAGCLGLLAVGLVGASLARDLGEEAKLADSAIGSMVIVAILGLGTLLVSSVQGARRSGTITWTVAQLSRSGGSMGDCLRHGNDVAAEEQARVWHRASALANTQILLGMVWTAGYLASQAGVFVDTAQQLKDGHAANLADSVAALLSLGPKAFLSTATAVSTSLVVGFIGARQVAALRGHAPHDPAMIATWTAGHRAWEQVESNRLVARDQGILEAALSNQSVRELNEAIGAAAATFSGLAGTVRDFNETASRIAAVQGTLEALALTVKASDASAAGVAAGLQSLAEEVRNNSAGLLAVSKEFGAELMRSSQTEGARLVGETVAQTMRDVRPEFNKLAEDLAKNMADSAESIRNRAANEFSGQMATVIRDLSELDSGVIQLRTHLGGLVNEVRSGTKAMEVSAASLATTMKAIGGSMDPEGRTLPAVGALERTRRELEATSAQLAKAAAQLAAGMDAVRKNAELIGRMREVTGATGGPRARS